MSRLLFTAAFLFMFIIAGRSQNIGLNDNNSDPDASAIVDVNSNNKGLLIPRVSLDSTLQPNPVTDPATSLLVYNTASIHDVKPGYYYWSGSNWNRLETNADLEINLSPVTKNSSATLQKTETMVIASGNIILTLPAITVADDGLEIVVKNAGTYTDLVIVKPQEGKKIDASDSSILTRWAGKTYLAYGSNWIVKVKDSRTDNLLDVSSTGSFTTIPEVLAYLGMHMGSPTVIRLGGGTYSLNSTQTIDLPYPVTFQGLSFGETIIECPSGDTAFNAISECYFKMLTFYGGETAGIGINITGNDTYYEIKDGYFYGFSKGVVVSSSADLWLFETDFDSCLTAGVEIDAGTTGNASFRSSECDYYNCAVGLNLISAGVNTEVAIINGTFYNTSGSQTGIKYLPTTGNNNFRFQSMIIQNNSYNNIGSFYSGFDFSRSDGRDAEVFFENNAGKESAAPHCKFNVTNNTSETTIINANTWYKAANFNSYNSYTTKWTITNNRIKYQSANSRDAISMISGNIRCNSSQARTINIAVVKNGASGTRYGETTVRIPSNNANQSFQFSTNVYLQDVSKDDYFEIWLTSGNSGDVLVIDDLNWFTQTF